VCVDKILGVDATLIERFLVLFRDNYREVDLATLFLEQSEGISNAQGFLNVRDAMSHFVTALSMETPKEKRTEQLATCEEHLRRAILEPYETTLNARKSSHICSKCSIPKLFHKGGCEGASRRSPVCDRSGRELLP